ncbi:MAG: T9SS type A sorting domain-containing protein [Bacteroidia bacterium]
MKKFTLLFITCVLAGVQALMGQAYFIDFEIQNATYTGTPGVDQAYEFDVMMKADRTGSYHSRGQIYVYYSTTLFGSSIITNGNVSFSEGDLLTETISGLLPKYSTVNTGVDNGNRFVFTWQPTFDNTFSANYFGSGDATHTLVPAAFDDLYHFKLDIPLANQSAALTATDASVAFDFTLMTGQQFLIDNTGTEQPYSDGFLPVEMLSFTAEKLAQDRVELAWVTTAELNNDFFAIEKLVDGGEYVQIGTVEGKGTTRETSNYTFVDDSRMGSVNQYRLRQVDLDGSFAYSEVVEVTFEFTAQQFYAYSSDFSSYVMFKAKGELDADYRFTVLDMNGKSLRAGVLSQGVRGGEVRIDLNGMATGMYFIRALSPRGEVTTVRFQKQ